MITTNRRRGLEAAGFDGAIDRAVSSKFKMSGPIFKADLRHADNQRSHSGIIANILHRRYLIADTIQTLKDSFGERGHGVAAG